MRIHGDYHTHTRYSEGTGSIRDNVEAARAAGLKDIGISDHGFNNYTLSLTRRKARKQRAEIENIRREYNDINIFSSIEADLVSLDGSVDMTIEEMYNYDYIIAGFHRWARPKSLRDYFKMYVPVYLSEFRQARPHEIVRNTDATIKMLERYPIAILAHINNATVVDCSAVAIACKDLNVLVELNLKHIVKNMRGGNMEKIIDSGAAMIMSSDAHSPTRVGKIEKIIEFIKPYGIEDRIVNLRDKTPDFRTYKNWKR